jgi:hypothetical protein
MDEIDPCKRSCTRLGRWDGFDETDLSLCEQVMVRRAGNMKKVRPYRATFAIVSAGWVSRH